jgi:hypothetical protein
MVGDERLRALFADPNVAARKAATVKKAGGE